MSSDDSYSPRAAPGKTQIHGKIEERMFVVPNAKKLQIKHFLKKTPNYPPSASDNGCQQALTVKHAGPFTVTQDHDASGNYLGWLELQRLMKETVQKPDKVVLKHEATYRVTLLLQWVDLINGFRLNLGGFFRANTDIKKRNGRPCFWWCCPSTSGPSHSSEISQISPVS